MSPLPARDGSRWQATAAVLVALALYELLPPRFTIGPLWFAPVLVLALLLPLIVMRVRAVRTSLVRATSIGLVAVVNFFNVVSVVLLLRDILDGTHLSGGQLLLAGVQVWFTNIIVFALWYWELDGGGPVPRSAAPSARDVADADFLFPQMYAEPSRNPWLAQGWKTGFVDYLYLAFVTATAFSPADVMPLSAMAKTLMLVESLISLVTLALVLARAVGILS